MSGVLAGQSALVTGGSAGIGLSSAELLARDGAAVTLMGRSEERLELARASVIATVPEARVEIFVGDGLSDADVEQAVAAAIAHGGGLDIVVATVGGGSYASMLEMEPAVFMGDLERNLLPPFLAVRHGGRAMTKGGSFVFISSLVSTVPTPLLAGYNAAKAGLDNLIRTGAMELGAKGIRLNGVRPGLTRTPGHEKMCDDPAMLRAFLAVTPLGRIGESLDIGNAVRFLSGPESAWITGQIFSIDGGNELRGPAL